MIHVGDILGNQSVSHPCSQTTALMAVKNIVFSHLHMTEMIVWLLMKPHMNWFSVMQNENAHIDCMDGDNVCYIQCGL